MQAIADILKLILLLALLCSGCAHYNQNPPLDEVSQTSGYRLANVRPPPTKDKPFVVLTFSGGGTRAAAFSFGVMEELRNVEYLSKDGVKRSILENVEIISSVSGGSFTSAYYALYPDCFFQDFPRKFLYRNIQGGLILRVLNPYNWFRLMSPHYSRIDMAEEFYGKTVFDNKTFADLQKQPIGRSPFLILNATDIGIAHRFEFTQDQFDLLCSDLSGVPISRAVAASSNFPVAFAPLTVDIYKHKCGQQPQWIQNAMVIANNPDRRRVADAMAAASYSEDRRRYAHLLDGGLSDNIGLRGPFNAFTTVDSPWSLVKMENEGLLGNLLVVSVNAKTTKKTSWDYHSTPPGLFSVLDVVLNGPMDDVSFDSVENTSKYFLYKKQLGATLSSCNKILTERCPPAQPVQNPLTTVPTFVELTFDDVADDRLRRCLQELPTSFSLPPKTIDLLRLIGGQLLMQSKEFEEGMKQLDPAWAPRTVQIDPKLISEACGEVR